MFHAFIRFKLSYLFSLKFKYYPIFVDNFLVKFYLFVWFLMVVNCEVDQVSLLIGCVSYFSSIESYPPMCMVLHIIFVNVRKRI